MGKAIFLSLSLGSLSLFRFQKDNQENDTKNKRGLFVKGRSGFSIFTIIFELGIISVKFVEKCRNIEALCLSTKGGFYERLS